MRTKKMGKKPEKIQGKARATGKVKSKNGKELVLPASKVGRTDQTAPPPVPLPPLPPFERDPSESAVLA